MTKASLDATRRGLLVAMAAAPVLSPPSSAQWPDVRRYPDPALESLDPAFDRLRINNTALERLFTGTRSAEGPAWFGDGRYLVWCDVPNDRLLRWDEATGTVGEFRRPAGHPNGATRDRQGRLLLCEHSGRRVSRTEHDGSITVVAERFDGKKLNSPNDVIVKSDDSVWFTDPPYGIANDYTGRIGMQELSSNIYRVDGNTGIVTVAADDLDRPNGLAFSPDERTLYVVESVSQAPGIRAYDVVDGARLANHRRFCDCPPGQSTDGIRVDTAGNLWCSWAGGERQDGVRVFTPEGQAIGHIHLPERCANLCFGGLERNRLFMAASKGLYAIYVNVQGTTRP